MLFKLPATIHQVKDEFKIEAGKPFKTVGPQGKLRAVQNIQRLMLNVDSVGQVGMTTNIAAENRVVAAGHSSMSPDNQTTKMANLSTPYCSYKTHTV
ncbi:hypothetical protein CU097_011376 [Rhizopus azygosporus]|uniref:Uncharacterized protein n=1 Tax=Rhizopus azygosporus TaxID=86630 RepID=A0A367JQH7_RHIAZ|nr:hypothetical protein CU097_011376 [Rhizopus azygosporus]